MKSEQKDSSLEIYRPNHALYRWLLVAATVIAFLSALIPQSNPLFSILIGIGSGGIASVAVAWLIDITTCRQKNEKTSETRRIVFSRLRFVIESGIQLFVMQCFRLKATTDFHCQKQWMEWMRMACDASKNDPEELQLFCKQCCVLADDIKEQTGIINSQAVLLLDLGIMGEDEKQELSAILNICDLYKPDLKRFGFSPELADRFLGNYTLLHAIIEKLPIVCEINTAQIGSSIYQKFDKDTLNRIYCSEEKKNDVQS